VKNISKMPICKEWHEKRMKHPFFAEKLGELEILRCWETSSRTYTVNNYKKIRDDILYELNDRKILNKKRTLLDIGCGPGTYAIPLSSHLKSIECLDSSHGMLARLLEECDKNNVENITTTFADWNTYVPSKKQDIAFTSLCPPTNSPESILKMEKCAKHDCVYISSANADSKISKALWKKVCKNYSFEGYNTNYPFQFLKEMGRSPELKMFTDKLAVDRSLEDAIDDEVKRFKNYAGTAEELHNAVREVLTDFSQDSRIITESEIRVGLLVWSPLS